MDNKPLETLLLCHLVEENASTIADHIDAIETYSGHNVNRVSTLGDASQDVNFEDYDVVVIHYSLILSKNEYVSPMTKLRLRGYNGLKVVLIQDEYRWVNNTIRMLRFLGIDLLFSCVPQKEIEKVYPRSELPRLTIKPTLTGFVPSKLLSIKRPDFHDRDIDVGYRGRKISAAYGRLAEEKWRIADGFSVVAKRHDLKIDIDYQESARLYGDKWIAFITNCKAMLGAESGASVFDFEGTIIPAVESAEKENNQVTFEELENKYFPGLDGKIKVNQISPRCFECASLGTLMVLFEGEYSGVLEPWKHYVPLMKDFSNGDEVINSLKDEKTWTNITTSAFEEIACNPDYSFRKFAEEFGDSIKEEHKRKKEDKDFGLNGQNNEFKDLNYEYIKLAADWQMEPSLVKYKDLGDAYQHLTGSHQDLGDAYQDLTGSHQDLGDAYQDLTGTYTFLTARHKDLVGSYQSLAASYQTVGEENSRLTHALSPLLSMTIRRLLNVYKYPYYFRKILSKFSFSEDR